MKKLAFIILSFLLFFTACSEDNDITTPRNLQGYLDENSNKEREKVIAFAGNAEGKTALTYIFYYPEIGATDIRYYETTDISAGATKYENYRRRELNSEAVFDGKLARLSRSGESETWCLVTYLKDGKFYISDPIRLKNNSKMTEYSDEVTINYKTITEPNFTWKDGANQESIEYLTVISDEENKFISGAYTENPFFQYFDTSNFKDSKINSLTSEKLIEDKVYNFSTFGISEDNWVNLIIEEQFIPRNLAEYVEKNPNPIEDVLAFASTANGNKEVTYIYFNAVENAFNFRYYETENTVVDKTNFNNYRRRSFDEEIIFDGKFRRFTHNSSDEVWCLITYVIDDKLHISEPIKTKNNSRATEYTTEVAISNDERLKPKFTWTDGNFAENVKYLQIFTEINNTFLSGTFTEEKTFQYYNEQNIIGGKIHSVTPPDLTLDDEYKFSLFGISEDHWVNLVIQKTFIGK